jgi:hypothetical protein
VPAFDAARLEALGPAERIFHTLSTWTDHLVHHRPGLVCKQPGTATGIRWQAVSVREGEVFGQRQKRLGQLREDGTVWDGGRLVGELRAPGLQPEVATWLYGQVASVWQLDHELVARWGSWAFAQEHRDLKVVLAAFLLVQSRTGEPVRDEGGQVLFFDEDYRDVGEAMCLLRRSDKRDLNPRLLLRVGELLSLPGVAALNRQLGFGASARRPPLGRWPRAVEKWLRHRERNPALLEGLVRAGFRTTVMQLARKVGYKPESARFFEVLRWRQKQAAQGHRELLLGVAPPAAESWAGLDEAAICARIASGRPDWKRLIGLLPKEPGLTPAIALAALAAGCLSDTDLVILTPTLEQLGLLERPEVHARWSAAVASVQNLRAANIAARVRRPETALALQTAADQALQSSLAEVTKDLRVYVFVDKSASMQGALERAQQYLTRFLQGFPLDQLHVATFNIKGEELHIAEPTAAGVARAFQGQVARQGTTYGAGIRALQHHRPKPGEDVVFLFVGDQEDGHGSFMGPVKKSGLDPVAFGLLEVRNEAHPPCWRAVENTARWLGIPYFRFDEQMFSDSYGVTRVLRELIASAPVRSRPSRSVDLLSVILNTPLLEKPAWA